MVSYQIIRFFADMGRKRNAIPNRIIHRPSGRDRIVWRGRSIYLGKHGTPEAEAAYRRVVRSILETGEPFPPDGGATVSQLAARFMVHTRKSFPACSSEPASYERAMKLLTDAMGDFMADDVTPARFAAMREKWAETRSVRTVNRHHNQTLAAFRWGVTVELVTSTVWHALEAVPRLKPKRSQARDPRIVGPVLWTSVEAIKPHVRPQVWAMILTQWHTGMRSGEMLAMTPGQIADWVYRPAKHKNAWRNHNREIPLGPRSREIIAPWMNEKKADQRIFDGYSAQSYGRAIARACKSAGIPHWHPHMLRHAYGSRVRASHGLDAAQIMLGHKHAQTTEIYAEKNSGAAKVISDELG